MELYIGYENTSEKSVKHTFEIDWACYLSSYLFSMDIIRAIPLKNGEGEFM